MPTVIEVKEIDSDHPKISRLTPYGIKTVTLYKDGQKEENEHFFETFEEFNDFYCVMVRCPYIPDKL